MLRPYDVLPSALLRTYFVSARGRISLGLILRGEYSFTLNQEELQVESSMELDIDFGLE
jgi:hypothetical protein